MTPTNEYSKVHPLFSCSLDVWTQVAIWRLKKIHTQTHKRSFTLGGRCGNGEGSLLWCWGVFSYHSQVKVTSHQQVVLHACPLHKRSARSHLSLCTVPAAVRMLLTHLLTSDGLQKQFFINTQRSLSNSARNVKNNTIRDSVFWSLWTSNEETHQTEIEILFTSLSYSAKSLLFLKLHSTHPNVLFYCVFYHKLLITLKCFYSLELKPSTQLKWIRLDMANVLIFPSRRNQHTEFSRTIST